MRYCIPSSGHPPLATTRVHFSLCPPGSVLVLALFPTYASRKHVDRPDTRHTLVTLPQVATLPTQLSFSTLLLRLTCDAQPIIELLNHVEP